MNTYDDIVTAKDILTGKVKKEDIIGKNGWLLDCIPQDMSLNVIARLGVHVCLTEIDLDSFAPFGDGGIPFTYFLPEKEESAPEPAYIPFDLSDPKDRDFLRGKWVRKTDVDELWEDKILSFGSKPGHKDPYAAMNMTAERADALLKYYEFLDGSPVGKRANKEEA